MSILDKPRKLIRFHWNLKSLPLDLSNPDLPKSYTLRLANPDEHDTVATVVKSSYSLDPIWNGNDKLINNFIFPNLKSSFHGNTPTCIVIAHGQRIVAASSYLQQPAEGIHLITGPCVLMEYRNRNLGSILLGATLSALRDLGLNDAIGQTLPLTTSAKYLFPKFGGKRIAPEVPPEDSSAPTEESSKKA